MSSYDEEGVSSDSSSVENFDNLFNDIFDEDAGRGGEVTPVVELRKTQLSKWNI